MLVRAGAHLPEASLLMLLPSQAIQIDLPAYLVSCRRSMAEIFVFHTGLVRTTWTTRIPVLCKKRNIRANPSFMPKVPAAVGYFCLDSSAIKAPCYSTMASISQAEAACIKQFARSRCIAAALRSLRPRKKLIAFSMRVASRSPDIDGGVFVGDCGFLF